MGLRSQLSYYHCYDSETIFADNSIFIKNLLLNLVCESPMYRPPSSSQHMLVPDVSHLHGESRCFYHVHIHVPVLVLWLWRFLLHVLEKTPERVSRVRNRFTTTKSEDERNCSEADGSRQRKLIGGRKPPYFTSPQLRQR